MRFVEVSEGLMVNLDHVASTSIMQDGTMRMYPAQGDIPVIVVAKELVPAMLHLLRRTPGHVYLPNLVKEVEEEVGTVSRRQAFEEALEEIREEKIRKRESGE